MIPKKCPNYPYTASTTFYTFRAHIIQSTHTGQFFARARLQTYLVNLSTFCWSVNTLNRWVSEQTEAHWGARPGHLYRFRLKFGVVYMSKKSWSNSCSNLQYKLTSWTDSIVFWKTKICIMTPTKDYFLLNIVDEWEKNRIRKTGRKE